LKVDARAGGEATPRVAIHSKYAAFLG
jgi:hypothetical protein